MLFAPVETPRQRVSAEVSLQTRPLAVESPTMFSRRSGVVLLAAGLVLALASCTMWEEKKASAWSSATGAEQFERLLWQEVKAGNWNEVERRLAPTYVEVTSAGVRDRAQAVERLQSLALADYSLGDLQVRPAGSDMAVAYTITLRASSGAETTLRMMTVWQQVKGGWIAVVHSETAAST